MNLKKFGKLALAMNPASRKTNYRFGSIALANLLAIGMICLPLWSSEPGADDGEKSSRKTKTVQPQTEPKGASPGSPKTEPKGASPGSPKTEPKGASPGSVSPASQTPKRPTTDLKNNEGKEKDDKNTGRLELDDAQGPAPIKNSLRAEGPLRLLSASENDQELSIEAQQKKDQGECPGAEGSKVPVTQNVNDVPLEQEEHPFDAPAAQTDDSPTAEDGELAPIKKAPPKSPAERSQSESAKRLEQRINSCLAHYFTHKESLAKRSPWAVMHTILPFGVETDIVAGHRNVNAIGWMCYNGVCKTQRVFQSTNTGFRTNVGPGVQGHEGQFLAILAQSSVPKNFPIMVGKNRYTVSDLIRYEMVTCREKSELTFKLIGLSHYLSPKQTWRDERGHTWNLEKLVREELDQPIVGAACGGTHRLMGLSYALMMRRSYEQPITGHWARADVFVNDFVQYAWTLQNPDGSFSTDWFEGRANEPNMERKVQTTGHILEWLVFTLPAEQLQDPRVSKCLEFLLSQVYDHRDKDWPIGPRGHSLRAISLYNQRVFGAPTGQLKSHLAQAGYMKDLR